MKKEDAGSNQDGQAQTWANQRDGWRGEVEMVCTCAEEKDKDAEDGFARLDEERKTSEEIYGWSEEGHEEEWLVQQQRRQRIGRKGGSQKKKK